MTKPLVSFDHHAYVLVGRAEALVSLVEADIEAWLARPLAGYPDYRLVKTDTFGIEDSQSLRAWQEQTSFSNGPKLFVLVCEQITREAQNALLKTFEEPTPGVRIFLIVPSERLLLPTLLSRVRLVKLEVSDADLEIFKKVEDFLVVGPEARLALIETIIGKEHPDRSKARQFVGALLKTWRTKHDPKTWTADEQFAVAELTKAYDYLHDPASLPKMILEHLALVV